MDKAGLVKGSKVYMDNLFMYLYLYVDNLFTGTNLLAPLAGTSSKPGARSKTQRLCLEMGKKDAKAVNMGKMEDMFTALVSFFPKMFPEMFMYLYYYMDKQARGKIEDSKAVLPFPSGGTLEIKTQCA